MGKVTAVACPRCHLEYPLDRPQYRCGDCGMVLEVSVDLSGLSESFREVLLRRPDRSIWRWREFLPIEDPTNIVTMGEGFTPLLRPEPLATLLGLQRIHIKNDTLLPTGSLKDRSNAVGISKAKEFGVEVAAVVSTGNAAVSVAAYSAAARIKSIVLIPEGTSPEKVAQIAVYGARIIPVKGSYDDAASLYRLALQDFGWYDCLSSNPYRCEGKKSYAYELWEQLDGEVPDWIVHPTAGGTGVVATWKGYNELRRLGWTDRLPRMVAAQAAAAAPLVRAFRMGIPEVEPVVARETVAESIRVGAPSPMATRALWAIRESGGLAVEVGDPEILEAQTVLARAAGIFAEPAAATSLAAAVRLKEEGRVRADDLVVCMVTGHGLKQPGVLRARDVMARAIPASLSELRRLLREEEMGA